MKIRHIILTLAALAAMSVQAAEKGKFAPAQGLGEEYASPTGDLLTHAVAKEFPQECAPKWNVSVDGHPTGLYNDVNFWGGFVHFGSFEMRNGRKTTIHIAYEERLDSFEILPLHRLNIEKVERTGANSIDITLSQANQNITIVPNGQLKGNVLHLFCNATDEDSAPKVAWKSGYHVDDAARLVWFGPGFHDLKALTGNYHMLIKNGYTVYLAPGAVVYGSMQMHSVDKGTRLCGRGMLYNDDANRAVIFSADNCKGADVEGIMMHGHRKTCWLTVVNHSQNVEFKHAKILSTRYASTDGIDVVNSNNCIFLNTFVRANDDAIAIKGLEEKPTPECMPNYNLTFCGMQLWNDCNCAIGIGAESHCSLYDRISFLNCDVLFSYDDPDYHCVLDERAALTINCLHGTHYRNIRYENIDVYHCERFIAAGFQPDFWFGVIKGDHTTPGGMSDIKYINVRSLNNSSSPIANKIRLYGWPGTDGTPQKTVNDVTFQNVSIAGRKLLSTDDPAFSETDFSTVEGIVFKQ